MGASQCSSYPAPRFNLLLPSSSFWYFLVMGTKEEVSSFKILEAWVMLMHHPATYSNLLPGVLVRIIYMCIVEAVKSLHFDLNLIAISWCKPAGYL